MRAIVHERYGRPEVLEFRDVDKPVLEDHQVLVRVHASSVNPVEWYGVTGPYFARIGNGLRKPKSTRVGADLAGRVEAVGRDVKAFQPGDEVFGTSGGSWAEFACASEERLAPKPANLSFEEAAAVPLAAITALQALRDKGQIEPGQKVLINGASGGVGTFAVQIAKSLGAEVTGVCSTRNVELVRSLGADHVVDYTQEDFTTCGNVTT
jgi:NADPH:quinone reductase-like Zn-dependent oxidoreductase